ncbi:hypothetical protein BJV74DRAFT_865871 [Russula compacta]|nr:hypothetical protein BJV74DRAFT_865871 [Russula compacta]
MSNLAALTSLLLLFPGFVVAQIFAPNCPTSSLVSWGWTFNSLDQNACTVAAYLMSTCNGGSFTINALQSGYSYTGPTGGIDDSNMCKCNTISYSLISACDACQGSDWISWSNYSANCTKTLPPSTFPSPVPAGTRIPKWALLDVTAQNNWNANDSFVAGDSPELGPGAVVGPSGVSTAASVIGTATPSSLSHAGASPSPTSGSDSSSNGSSSSSNVGAIAGGVAGGIAAVAIAGVAVFFFLRRGRRQAPSTPLTAQQQMEQVQHLPPPSDDGTFAPPSAPGTPLAPMRLYDPNDPTTFPGYQAVPPDSPPSVPFSPYSASGHTLATTHTPRPQGYHGLPTV